MKIKYTKEILETEIKKSLTWADVCRTLGIKPATGSQTHLKNKAKEFNIDFSHFLGKASNKGKTPANKRHVSDYLSLNGVKIKSHELKEKLIRDGLKERKCEKCSLTEWQGKPIPIELDHINGNNVDNRLENLQILCPNCHAQTSTYCSKNLRACGEMQTQ